MSDGQWDETKSYSYGEGAYYNGYLYQYINHDKPSTPGSKPNEETFSKTYDGESRTVRSWTIVELLNGGFLPSVQAFNWPTYMKGVRGLPQDAIPSKPPRFEYQPSFFPFKKVTDDINQIGTIPDITLPGTYIQKIFPSGGYVDDGCGYNVEYKSSIYESYSNNIVEMLVNYSGTGGKSIPTSYPAFKMEYEQSTSEHKCTLRIYTFPATENFGYISKGASSTLTQWASLFNTFGRRFSIKYLYIVFNEDGSVRSHQDETVNVTSGPYRDKYAERGTPYIKELDVPVEPPGCYGMYFLVSYSDPAHGIDFTQEIKLLDDF